MKRCPECRRDYFDDTLAFCLEDGTALVQGSVSSPDEWLAVDPAFNSLRSDARFQDLLRRIGLPE